MKKKIIAIITVLIVIIIVALVSVNIFNTKKDLIEIKSEDELQKISDSYSSEGSKIAAFVISPYISSVFGSIFNNFSSSIDIDTNYKSSSSGDYSIESSDIMTDSTTLDSATDSFQEETSTDYSTTNLQVENVDEADIVKTDGEYVYSLSNDTVYITYARNAADMAVVSKIEEPQSNMYPEDLIIQNNKLIVISGNNDKTIVRIYDLTDKSNPNKIKQFELSKKYYTSRFLNGNLYVISSGLIDEEDNLQYIEDGENVNPDEPNAYKIKDIYSRYQTIIASYNLNEVDSKIKVQSYLINIENAYISENNMYLIDNGYSGGSNPTLANLYGIKGVFGLKDIEIESRTASSSIYKFNFKDDGTVEYQTKTTVKGTTIDQFSLDEKDGNLRVALYTTDGSRVVVLDNDLKQIGESRYLAKGETMYSARFMGDGAYLVTYKTVDPLYSIDLSDPTYPKVLGELKIPGYSTYLHPYDENHLIGIGMQTEEKIYRDSSGKVTSTSAVITGMKMALFDVTDVNNPIQISDTIIGDSRTTSAILTNHKALLFSKEKGLLAIPVNNYTEDFEIESSSDDYESMVNSYTNYNKKYVSEGYFVYNINLTDGFTLKGTITHEKTKSKYSYYNTSRLLRGLYIDDNLYTVSEDYIKVNRLDDLQEISQLKIKED